MVSFRDTAVDWLKSHLPNRTFSVVARLTCGVPQASTLGPVVLCIHAATKTYCMHQHNIQYDFNPDDTKNDVPLKTSEESNLHELSCPAK